MHVVYCKNTSIYNTMLDLRAIVSITGFGSW